jgi:hypothetical protein
MKKRLPINDKPLVRAYATYCYIESIANNELTTGNKILEFELFDYERYDWKIVLNDLRLEKEIETISIAKVDFNPKS